MTEPKDFDAFLNWLVNEVDAKERQEVHERFTRAQVSTTGALCFAGRGDNVPMWSYYSDNHEGVCLRFGMSSAFLRWAFDGGILGRVRYSADYPRVKFYEAHHAEWIQALLFTKGEDWAHEEEWRIARDGGIGPRAFPPEYLDAVILGARISDSDRKFVLDLVGRRPVATEVLQAKARERSFQLAIIAAK